jgi:hypothetical protein
MGNTGTQEVFYTNFICTHTSPMQKFMENVEELLKVSDILKQPTFPRKFTCVLSSACTALLVLLYY